MKNLSIRYFVATIGLFLAAVGTALAIIANLGTAPITCPSYVLAVKFPSLTVGTWTTIFNLSLILVQVAVLRKEFKLSDLMQIPAVLLFSWFIDINLNLLAFIGAPSTVGKYILTFLSIAITALGISIEVLSNAWMISGDRTVWAISKVSKKKFNNVKIALDCLLVVIVVGLCLLWFGKPFGDSQSNVIGIGTLLMAILTGMTMNLTDKVAKSLFGNLLKKH